MREEPILLNVDETAIQRFMSGRHGHVCRAGRGVRPPTERVNLRDEHGHVTLVACAAAEAGLQHLCPQLILAKASRLSAAERAELRGWAAPVQFLEGTDGWVTGANVAQVLTRIRRPFLVHHPHRRLVILWDAAQQHLSEAALRQAARLHIVLVIVPASMTWLLQPLDTHVFRALKREMHERQLQGRMESEDGRLHRTAWLRILRDACQKVLLEAGARWTAAFDNCGVTGVPERFSSQLQTILGPDGVGAPLEPTDAALSELVGRPRAPGFADRLLRLPRRIRDGAGPVLPPPPYPPREASAPGSSGDGGAAPSPGGLGGPAVTAGDDLD